LNVGMLSSEGSKEVAEVELVEGSFLLKDCPHAGLLADGSEDADVTEVASFASELWLSDTSPGALLVSFLREYSFIRLKDCISCLSKFLNFCTNFK